MDAPAYLLIRREDGSIWKRLNWRKFAEETANHDRRIPDVGELDVVRACDYCDSAPATGYVGAYDAHVCRECYDDHHGPC